MSGRKRLQLENSVFFYDVKKQVHSTIKIGDFVNKYKNFTIVYGGAKDVHLLKGISGDGFPGSSHILPIKVSQNDIDIISTFPNDTIHVMNFLLETPIMKNFIVLNIIQKRVDNLSYLSNFSKLNSEIYQIYQELVKEIESIKTGYKNTINQEFLNEMLKIATAFKLYDEPIFQKLKTLEEYCEGLELVSDLFRRAKVVEASPSKYKELLISLGKEVTSELVLEI